MTQRASELRIHAGLDRQKQPDDDCDDYQADHGLVSP